MAAVVQQGAGRADPRNRSPKLCRTQLDRHPGIGAKPSTAALDVPDSTLEHASRCCGDGSVPTVKDAGACGSIASTADRLFKLNTPTRCRDCWDCLPFIDFGMSWVRVPDRFPVSALSTPITAAPRRSGSIERVPGERRARALGPDGTALCQVSTAGRSRHICTSLASHGAADLDQRPTRPHSTTTHPTKTWARGSALPRPWQPQGLPAARPFCGALE